MQWRAGLGGGAAEDECKMAGMVCQARYGLMPKYDCGQRLRPAFVMKDRPEPSCDRYDMIDKDSGTGYASRKALGHADDSSTPTDCHRAQWKADKACPYSQFLFPADVSLFW